MKTLLLVAITGACVVPAASVRGQFVLVSDSRRTEVLSSISDLKGGDGDFSQEFAVPFQPFNSATEALALYLGVSGSAQATQVSVVETDLITIVAGSHATVQPPGQLDASFVGTSALDVVFDIAQTTEVMIEVELLGFFQSHDVLGQASMQLWREDPCPALCDVDADCPIGNCVNDPNPGDGNAEGFCQPDNCLVHDWNSCGTVHVLEPGTYRMLTSTQAFAQSFSGSEPNGGSADAVAAVTVSTVAASTESFIFDVDPITSQVTITIQFPNEPPQVFVLDLTGSIQGDVTTVCGLPGLFQMGSLNLTGGNQSLEIIVPGAGPGGVITVSDINAGLDGPSTRGGLVNNSGTVEGNLVVTGEITGPESGFLLFNALLQCLLDLLCTSSQCDDLGPAGPGFDTLELPGINFTTELDLGLGAMNPDATIAGDITAALVEPCPWDCGDGDGVVGIVDFLALLAQWGGSGSSCDLGLGTAGVGIEEFLDLLANWGPCP